MNPLAPIVASSIVGLVVLVSFDPVSVSVALVCEVLTLPWLRLPAQRMWPIVGIVGVSAVLGAMGTALYGRPSGETLFAWGPINVTTGSLDLAVLVGLRIVAIALPGALVFAATNLTSLADALTQIARLPSRFVAGALSSLRMMSLLADDWRTMGYARRARGLASRSPQQFAGQSFALFVRAVRRGSALATTMEARGFGGNNERSWARVSVWRTRDGLIVAGGFVIAALVVGISVGTGSWQVVVFG
jgi:energy-coupling factor transport system permease protein